MLLFIHFFRENQISWFFRIIQQNPSPFVHPTWTDFSPTALCTKKQTSQRESPMKQPDYWILQSRGGIACCEGLWWKSAWNYKKKCIFSRFFRTMPRFLTRPIWRVPSANPQTICEWVTPNPPSSLRKFQIFDFFQEKMQTPSLWYIFGIVFRNAFEKIPGFPRRRYEKIKQLHRQETPLRKSMYLRRLNGNARTFSSKPKATQDSMWFSHDWKWKWLNCFSVCVRHPCAECHAITTANWHELWHKHSLQTNLRTRP